MGWESWVSRTFGKTDRHGQQEHMQVNSATSASKGGYGAMRLSEAVWPTDEDALRLPVTSEAKPREPRHTLNDSAAPGTPAAKALDAARSVTSSTPHTPIWRRRLTLEALAWLASTFLAALAIALLGQSTVARRISAFLAAFNFDQERVLLMTTLLLLVGGCVVGGALLRRRLAALLGGLLYYCLAYLLPFVQRVQHPPLGPAGLRQELIAGALPHMLLMLSGLALLAASIGSALGAAFGELVVMPLVGLASALWRWGRQPTRIERQAVVRRLPQTVLGLGLGGLLVAALSLSQTVPGTLLTYGIEGTLYRLVPGQTSSTANIVAHGTVLHGNYTSASLRGAPRDYAIYLPPSYTVAAAERYPVLYLLHGSPGSPNDWMIAGKAPLNEDALLAIGRMRETIIVSANGNGAIYLSEWANSYDGRQKMEDAVAFDLVHIIDQRYRTLPDAADRAIGGNSEGGFGAVNIALHHPEVFGTAISFAGYFVAEGATFGYGPSNASYHAYNSPVQYIYTTGGAHSAHSLRFIICAGTKDGIYFTDSQDFYQRLIKMGVKATFQQNSGGHGWGLWSLQLGDLLPLIEPAIEVPGIHP